MGKVAEYERGIKDGLRAYAHWKDGRQEVGTTGTLLADALARIPKLHVYDPPDDDEEPQIGDEDEAGNPVVVWIAYSFEGALVVRQTEPEKDSALVWSRMFSAPEKKP